MLSMTTDYRQDSGSPGPYLRRIAEAGFSHVHWCHHWNDDFVYDAPEIEQIQRWFNEFSLRLNDLHASAGVEKRWASTIEYERQAGVLLVQNRIEMARRLGGDVVILHMPAEPSDESGRLTFWNAIHASLNQIESTARDNGVRIALENLTDRNFPAVRTLLREYSTGFVGVCYDSGHGNITSDGLDQLDLCKDRLISLHLHDNDGSGDAHQPLFSGTVDWQRLARIIAESSYAKMVSLEVSMRGDDFPVEDSFLKHAFEGGLRFASMIEMARSTKQ